MEFILRKDLRNGLTALVGQEVLMLFTGVYASIVHLASLIFSTLSEALVHNFTVPHAHQLNTRTVPQHLMYCTYDIAHVPHDSLMHKT